MAGRITDGDKERVRDANRIDQVVGEYVALKSAGGGNLKGLCPFHDEKTASFTVSPSRGTFHCFGCQEGGDVFAFIAKHDHLDFVEAVQQLADRVGITLTLVEGGTSTRAERGSRARLIAANKAAAAFYAVQLSTEEATPARQFLADRGFDQETATRFGCGYAAGGWDQLFKALSADGFSVEELEKAGLVSRGQRGPIDRFHRRLLWSIRDAAGDVVGFGARRLFDDDRLEAKYINTSETPLYKKSQMLYGLDLAKKEIARQRQVVVVEGYTDVMAMHLAGVATAVASCGTAFGDEHISVLRRYLLDNDIIRGEVIYTFDGDSAGQKAALKAYDSDQKFAANTFVAVAPEGMDPCELRQARGDGAVRDLVAGRQPLFAFAIRSTLDGFDLETAEGRVAAAAAAIPMVASIKEPALRHEYGRQLAGWLGADHELIGGRVRQHAAAVAKAATAVSRRTEHAQRGARDGRDVRESLAGQDVRDARAGQDVRDPRAGQDVRHTRAAPDMRDTRAAQDMRDTRAAPEIRDSRAGEVARDTRDMRDLRGGQDVREVRTAPDLRATGNPDAPAERRLVRPQPEDRPTMAQRETLKLVLQQPALLARDYGQVAPSAYTEPAYQVLHRAVLDAGGPGAADAMGATAWVGSISEHLPVGGVRSLVTELTVEPLNTKTTDLARYAGSILAALAEPAAKVQEDTLRSDLQRAEATGDSERATALNADLAEIARYRRALSERAKGA